MTDIKKMPDVMLLQLVLLVVLGIASTAIDYILYSSIIMSDSARLVYRRNINKC